nr:MAG TPA: hypothetical protein [Caudoviricetes sp.]
MNSGTLPSSSFSTFSSVFFALSSRVEVLVATASNSSLSAFFSTASCNSWMCFAKINKLIRSFAEKSVGTSPSTPL